MKAIVTPFSTGLAPTDRKQMDKGKDINYKSFDELYQATKMGALTEHVKEAGSEVYIEVVLEDDNRAGLYLGMSGAGEGRLNEEIAVFIEAVQKLFDQMYTSTRKTELRNPRKNPVIESPVVDSADPFAAKEEEVDARTEDEKIKDKSDKGEGTRLWTHPTRKD